VRNERGDIIASNKLGYALYSDIHAEIAQPHNVARQQGTAIWVAAVSRALRANVRGTQGVPHVGEMLFLGTMHRL
jgi:hypothetical protein